MILPALLSLLVLVIPPASACSCDTPPPQLLPGDGTVVPATPVFWLLHTGDVPIVRVVTDAGEPVPVDVVGMGLRGWMIRARAPVPAGAGLRLVVWVRGSEDRWPFPRYVPQSAHYPVAAEPLAPPATPRLLSMDRSAGDSGTSCGPASFLSLAIVPPEPGVVYGIWRGPAADPTTMTESLPPIVVLEPPPQQSIVLGWGFCLPPQGIFFPDWPYAPRDDLVDHLHIRSIGPDGRMSPPLEVQVPAVPPWKPTGA